jgi:hypothetical protein
MSLPAGEQRILDGIADGLRREPKLAAMYAMFTRLCGSEGLPRQEQLSSGSSRSRLPSRLAGHARDHCLRLLVLSQVAIALVLLAVLVGLSWRSSASCGKQGRQRGAAQALLWCPPQAADGHLVGK